jgi:serine/threonine protein kinase
LPFKRIRDFLYKRCGTPGFTAPEVLNSMSKGQVTYDSKCDIYSLGIIFYFLQAGTVPFNSRTKSELLKKNRCGIIKFKVPELAHLDPNSLDLLKQMLAYQKEARISKEACMEHPYLLFPPIFKKTSP